MEREQRMETFLLEYIGIDPQTQVSIFHPTPLLTTSPISVRRGIGSI
jgi:hypothetical protein